jgi:hypothetical protein
VRSRSALFPLSSKPTLIWSCVLLFSECNEEHKIFLCSQVENCLWCCTGSQLPTQK